MCAVAKKGEIGQTYTSEYVIEFTVNDDFRKPIDETNCNVGSRWPTVDDYKLAHGLKPTNEDDRIAYISYTAANTSEYDRTIDETGVVVYDGDNKYSDGQLAHRVSEKGVRKGLPNVLSLPKLDGEKFEFRAYTIVPKEAVESDKPLTITIHGYDFEIRK